MNLTIQKFKQHTKRSCVNEIRLVIVCFVVCFLTQCGDAVIPLGGIVGNGQKPEKAGEKTPVDSQTDPSIVPEQALAILGGRFTLQLPLGYKRLTDSMDIFESNIGLKLTFNWTELTTNCEQRTSFQTNSGLEVKVCSDTRAIVDVNYLSPDDPSKAQIEVHHALNEATLKGMLNTLKSSK